MLPSEKLSLNNFLMKLWLAPLHGITQYSFRNCLLRHTIGISSAITPFLPIQSYNKLNVKKWCDIWPENNRNIEIIPQLMGNNPSDFLDTVLKVFEVFGYNHFNWNIGCPVNQIVRRKRGCGLMPYPDIIEEVTEKICEKTNCKLSIKMRLGLHDVSESYEIIKRINKFPLEFIVIHPRLGEWQYGGSPDLNTLDDLVRIAEHEIVYSGDIVDLKSFNILKLRFPDINQWMLGRGILQNPFLSEQIINGKQEENSQYTRRFYDFYQDIIQSLKLTRNDRGVLVNLKELWHYFAVHFKLNNDELSKLLRINELSEFVTSSNYYIQKSVG
jgi:tRNA-dihydrouridine synthase B